MTETFIDGTVIYLRAPDLEEDIIKGHWHQWFNDESVTQYLVHGVYPNTREKQIEYIKNALCKSDMILLSIIDKNTNEMCGVTSLRNIDLINRRAEIAIVMGNRKYTAGAPFEAMALMTRHGFDKLNLNKIYAGQHINLWKWVNTLELLGYKLEGYIRENLIRYGKAHDSVMMGITASDFYKLLDKRKGNIITDDLMSLLAKRRKDNICLKLSEAVRKLYGN